MIDTFLKSNMKLKSKIYEVNEKKNLQIIRQEKLNYWLSLKIQKKNITQLSWILQNTKLMLDTKMLRTR